MVVTAGEDGTVPRSQRGTEAEIKIPEPEGSQDLGHGCQRAPPCARLGHLLAAFLTPTVTF